MKQVLGDTRRVASLGVYSNRGDVVFCVVHGEETSLGEGRRE